MAETLSLTDFLEQGRHGVIVDVRTPAEFEAGHIEGAVNIPLFTNEERVIVGTIYKRVGKEQAIEKGLELVGTKLAEFVRTAKKLSKGRKLLLYCWRGGMRSGSMAWLFSTAGLEVGVLRGGYKAFRRNFDRITALHWQFVTLNGMTGSGKSELLEILSSMGEQVLDLEGLANHKGSAFGAMGQEPQPTTEEFINRIHNSMRRFTPERTVWCEGESMQIGHVCIPPGLFYKLQASDFVTVEMNIDRRVERLMSEYGSFPKEQLADAFSRISRRMGPEKAKAAIEMLDQYDIKGAAELALRYYDKGYATSTSRRTGRQLFVSRIEQQPLEDAAKEIIFKVKS